jgi:hypothetical protein
MLAKSMLRIAARRMPLRDTLLSRRIVMKTSKLVVAASIASLTLALNASAQAQPANMTFFVTSVGSGKGADYGGLAGADKHCQTLAAAAGAGSHMWHAYLSTSAMSGSPAVNARDRIGTGPWQNAKGVVIARNVAELHGSNNLTKQTALTEKGEVNNGRGDTPNKHDILTGSQPDGTAFPGSGDQTCGNWTKNGDGAAQLGHHDRQGSNDPELARSWNSSHISLGCSDDGLRSTGGAGLLYCFADK